MPAYVMDASMTLIPDHPDALLPRDKFAAALTEAGFPTSAKTLATKATRGGGPPFQKYGPRALSLGTRPSVGTVTAHGTASQHQRERAVSVGEGAGSGNVRSGE